MKKNSNFLISRDYINKPFYFHSSCFEINHLNIIQKFFSNFFDVSKILSQKYKNRLIYGITNKNGIYKIEYYVYNYYIHSNEIIRIQDFIRSNDDMFSLNIIDTFKNNYFMFSFELNDNKKISMIDVYSGDFCYILSDTFYEMKNRYIFYPKDSLKNLIHVLREKHNNADLSKIISILYFFNSSLYKEGTICISEKFEKDGLYFSHINYQSFLSFLRLFNYKEDLIVFFEEAIEKYEYYHFDIGIDYTFINNKLNIIKTGFYFYLGTSIII